MNQLDLMLDIITGTIKDHPGDQQRDVKASSSRIDLSELHKFNWQQIHSLHTTLMSNTFFTKIFSGCLTHKKKKNETSTVIVPGKTTVKIFKNVLSMISLKNSSKRNKISNGKKKSKHSFINDLLGYDTDVLNDSMKEDCENSQLTNDDDKYQDTYNADNKGDNLRQGLELFLQSVINCTKEFNEEEILELQIQILKSVKNIKGKRDLKLNLRRYCVASMSFSDAAKKT